MKNYLYSEFWRVFRRPWPWVLLGAALLVGGYLLFIWPAALPLILYFAIPLIPMCVFGEDQRSGPLKNTVSFGISRVELYFGKLMVEAVLGLLLAGALALSALPFGTRAVIPQGVAAAVPLWLSGLAVAHWLHACMRDVFALVAYWGIAGALLILYAIFPAETFALANPPVLLSGLGGMVEAGRYASTLPAALGWLGAAAALGCLTFSWRELK